MTNIPNIAIKDKASKETLTLEASVSKKINHLKKFQSKTLSHDELNYLNVTNSTYPLIPVEGKYYILAISKESFTGVVWAMDWFEIKSVYRDKDNTCRVLLNISGEDTYVNYGIFHPKNIAELTEYGIVVNLDLTAKISKCIYKKLSRLKIDKVCSDIGFTVKDGKLLFNAYDEKQPILQYTHDLTFEQYRDGLNELLTNGAIMFALCCGCSSMFLAYLIMKCDIIIDRFVISFNGRSTTGKSTAQILLASIYSAPTDEKVFTPANGTTASLLKRVANKNGIPQLFDEMTALKGMDIVGFIYTMSMGHDRYRCNSNSTLRENDKWNTLVNVTSEERTLNKVKMHNKGLDARCLCFENLQYTDSREHSEQIKSFCSRNYGIIGKALSEYLVSAEPEEIVTRYNSCRDSLRTAIGDDRFDMTERLVNEYALILLSAEYLSDNGIKVEPAEIVSIITASHNEISENTNIAKRYYDHIMSYVAANPVSASIKLKQDKNEVSILETLFVEILEKYGATDIDLVVRELESSGYLIRGRKNTPKSRERFNGGILTNCYRLRLPEEEKSESVSLEDVLKNYEGLDEE